MELRELLDDLFDYRISAPEKLPKRIMYNNIEFIFKNNSYYSVANDNNIMNFVDHTLDLRCQVEIMQEDKDIEKIELSVSNRIIDNAGDIIKYIDTNLKDRNIYIPKINELIDEINKLKKGE